MPLPTSKKSIIKKLIKEIYIASKILITTHQDPDGDALGACLALTELLTPLNKITYVYTCGTISEEWKMVFSTEAIKINSIPVEKIDLAIILDCHEPSRIGQTIEKFISNFPQTLIIDHHLNQNNFGKIRWIDPTYAATCEMIIYLAKKAGWKVTPKIASYLFTGLFTDSGRFSYSNTTARLLRSSAKLIDLGAKPWDITQKIFSINLTQLNFIKYILKQLIFLADNQIVYSKIKRKDLYKFNIPYNNLNRIIEKLITIRPVELAILLKEKENKKIRISLRSKNYINVGTLASCLGGGGHKNAAGVILNCNLEIAKSIIIKLAIPIIKEK